MGTGEPGKSGPCWRDVTEAKGFAGRVAPTWAPTVRENPDHVGVT